MAARIERAGGSGAGGLLVDEASEEEEAGPDPEEVHLGEHPVRGREPDEVPRILKETLMEEGVAEDAIEMVPSESAAVDTILRMAAQEDLVLIFGDELERTWSQIVHFRPDSEGNGDAVAQAAETPGIDLPDLPQETLQFGGRLLRDDRGVYLAPEQAD